MHLLPRFLAPSSAPVRMLRGSAGMALLLAFLATAVPGAFGQTTPSSSGASTPAAPASASVQRDTTASAAAAATPPAAVSSAAVAVAQCAACPRQLTAGETQAVVDAAALIQQAAKDLKQDDSFWTNVGVNVFSNRLDAWLFGSGADKQGMFALLAAWAGLAVAVIKLLLAWRLPAGTSGFRRTAEVVLSLALCVSGGLAVLAVHTARASVASAAAPTETLAADLSSCRQSLNSALANAAANSTPSAMRSTEMLGRVEAACTAVRNETSTRLNHIAAGIEDVRSSQVGGFLKVLIFLAFCGTAFLVWRVVSRL